MALHSDISTNSCICTTTAFLHKLLWYTNNTTSASTKWRCNYETDRSNYHAPAQPTSNGVTPQTYQQQTVAQGTTNRVPTQTITGTTPTTQQVQNGGVTTKPSGQTTTQSVQPTSNGVTPQSYQQQTIAQGTTTRVPTQTITVLPNNTTSTKWR